MNASERVFTPGLVTIALPIWKRLEYLPHILKIIEGQDYPHIELIVSDNGENGTKVHDAVRAHYSRPFRFRQNPKTVSMGTHFNQILEVGIRRIFLSHLRRRRNQQQLHLNSSPTIGGPSRSFDRIRPAGDHKRRRRRNQEVKRFSRAGLAWNGIYQGPLAEFRLWL